jgi:hypothetical protein
MNSGWIAFGLIIASISISGEISNFTKAYDKRTEMCITKGGAA